MKANVNLLIDTQMKTEKDSSFQSSNIHVVNYLQSQVRMRSPICIILNKIRELAFIGK